MDKGADAYASNAAAGLVEVRKWLRVQLGGVVVADTKRGRLLRQKGRIPVYLFPEEDVRSECLDPDAEERVSTRGRTRRWTVRAGGSEAPGAAWAVEQAEGADLDGYVGFDWDAMDAWFEEDEEVYVHARDPFKRVDDLESSRHVQVVVAGEIVADSGRPVVLFETGLPERYYLPKTDVRMDILAPSDTVTRCPYKGRANYYSVRAGERVVEDIAWYYRYPAREVPLIAGYICFYDERADAVYVDGEERAVPTTPWSR